MKSIYGAFTYIYHIKLTIHVGKYTIPMDGKGMYSHNVSKFLGFHVCFQVLKT